MDPQVWDGPKGPGLCKPHAARRTMAGPQPTPCENGHLRHGRRRACGRRHGQLDVGPFCGRVAQIGQYNICVGSFCGRVAQIGQSPTQFGQPLRKRGFLDVVLKGAVLNRPGHRAGRWLDTAFLVNLLRPRIISVSYTHLTLPTICSV